MRHRTRLAALACCSTLTLTALAPNAALARDFDDPYSHTARPTTILRPGSPESVGLRSAPIEAARTQVRAHMAGETPLYPGVVGVMGHDGRIVATETSGYARLYADADAKLPESEQIPMREDTIFDLASVSKLFTSIAVVQLIEQGKVELDAPVARYLPNFAANGKQGITVRQLLTHTSGLPAGLPLWRDHPNKQSRLAAVLDVKPESAPDTTYLYSDLNLITLGMLVERQTGTTLDQAVARGITGPLAMNDTGYNPTNKARVAATEFQSTPDRGMVWGEVHDENAWSLGGVAGHAGVFSTANDLAILCQALLNGGTYRHQRILAKDSVDLLLHNFNTKFPGDDHGLGFELNQRWYAEGLSHSRQAGHTGYTGTSIVIDFTSHSFAVLLTNRVHPARTGPSVNPARREWAQGLALAMPVDPAREPDAWFTGVTNATTATLELPLQESTSSSQLSFRSLVDVEETDPLVLERSADGGKTWSKVPFTVRIRGQEDVETDGAWANSGLRRWVRVQADVPAGTQVLRWRQTTDENYLGRGTYVDDVQLRGGVRFDGEKSPSSFRATQWTRASH